MAAGVFAAEKFILANRIVERLFISEKASLFGEQLGDSKDTCICLGRGGIIVIDSAVKIEDTFVIAPGALIFGTRL